MQAVHSSGGAILEIVKTFIISVYTVLTCARITINVIITAFNLIVFFVLATALYAPSINSAYTTPFTKQYNSMMISLWLPFRAPKEAVHLAILVKPLLVGILCVAAFNCVTGIMGCLAVVIRSKILMIIHIALLVINFVALVVLFSLLRGGRTKLGEAHETLMKELKEKYEGIDSNNSFSVMLNAIMTASNCCGLNGYEDFAQSKWSGTRNITLRNVVLPMSADMPLPCCSLDGIRELIVKLGDSPIDTVQGVSTPSKEQLEGLNCANKTNTMNNKSRGCYDLIWDMVEAITDSTFFLAIFCIIFILSGLNIILCCIALWLMW